MKDWNPALYLRFANERTRPAQELVARIAHPNPNTVSDLGCGPGNSTELLAQAWPHAAVTGIDSSATMLAQAREHLPQQQFELADIATWQPAQPQDVIYANASLQWVPEHTQLFPHLAQQLAHGGMLAVQMPDNLDEPSHRLMRAVAEQGRWRDKIGDTASVRQRLLTSSAYYDLLTNAGCDVDLWRTTYYHPMDDAQAIVDWLRATGLRPFLAQLDDAEQAAFLDSYRQQLETAYPPHANGKRLLAFPRLFMVARKR